MFGKGFKLAAEKNGRTKTQIVTFEKNCTFVVNGRIKQSCTDFKNVFKLPNPLRSSKVKRK